MKVLHNGEALEGDDKDLQSLGVKENDVVNVVPVKKKTVKKVRKQTP